MVTFQMGDSRMTLGLLADLYTVNETYYSVNLDLTGGNVVAPLAGARSHPSIEADRAV